jgi:hypothetical protein
MHYLFGWNLCLSVASEMIYLLVEKLRSRAESLVAKFEEGGAAS